MDVTLNWCPKYVPLTYLLCYYPAEDFKWCSHVTKPLMSKQHQFSLFCMCFHSCRLNACVISAVPAAPIQARPMQFFFVLSIFSQQLLCRHIKEVKLETIFHESRKKENCVFFQQHKLIVIYFIFYEQVRLLGKNIA